MTLPQTESPVFIVPPFLAPPSSLSVLIIDDDAFDRSVIRRLMIKMMTPNTLVEIATISSIKSILERDSFDVILLDYRLPEGDGFEAMKIIRSHPTTANCPVIMIAGDAQPNLAINAIEGGCHDFIAKRDLTTHGLEDTILQAVSDCKQTARQVVEIRNQILAQVQVILKDQVACFHSDFEGIVMDLNSLWQNEMMSQSRLLVMLNSLNARCLQLQVDRSSAKRRQRYLN